MSRGCTAGWEQTFVRHGISVGPKEIHLERADPKDAARRAEADQAIYNLGHALENLGRHEDALNVYERLIASLEGRSDAQAMEALARALFAKGTILRNQDEDADAIAVYDRLLNQLRDSPDPPVQTQILLAMGNKAASLAKLGDSETAMAIREEIVRRYAGSRDTEQRAAVAVAWAGKIATIAQQGDHSKVVTECDEMLGWASDARDPKILQHVARVLNVKSGSARADLVRRFRGEPDDRVQNAVANALIADVTELEASGRLEDALAVVDDLLTRFPPSMNPAFRRNFYGLTVGRGLLLAHLARCRDAVASAAQAYEQLASAHDEEAQALLPRAIATAGFARLCLAKQTWQGGDEAGARVLLEEAESKLQMALERAPADPSVMGDAAYAAFLLGHQDKARDMLTRAIALGGSKVREAALKDADICTLPQDDAFRELARSIPDAPRA